jgi:ribonuclease BN (tRNA processing enzyme)
MRAIFLGVGEACDETLANVSVLVRTEVDRTPRSVMLDCGFNVPWRYWQQADHPDVLDALYISHFHGDHFMGTPALLLRFWETKRRKPLAIVGQEGIEDLVRSAMELAYPGFIHKLEFALDFVTVGTDGHFDTAGLGWSFARNEHSQRDFAVRIDDGKKCLFYSGDGKPTPETLELARGVDLVVHEAFLLDEEWAGHGTVRGCIRFAKEAGASALALVHINRDERKNRLDEIRRVGESVEDLRVIVPEMGDVVDL